MDRREFIKIIGITSAATALPSCVPSNSGRGAEGDTDTETKDMTYRQFPAALGDDRVSLLGYGCMRWPTIPNPDGNGDMIDQDAVNRLVDYAIEHGVNFFDTSPVYVQGWS